MKYFQMKCIALGFGMLLLAACSGSDSGGGGTTPSNTMSVMSTASTNPKALQPKIVADKSNAIVSAHRNTTDNKTIIQICRDVDRDNDCSQLIVMTLDGTSAQTYAIAGPDSLTQIALQDDDDTEGIFNHYLSNSGQIEVTRLDNAVVAGKYNAVLECNNGCTGTITVNGEFNVDVTP